MMSRIIMSTWTGRPCIDPRATVFFETTAPRVRMYDSSKAPDTKRWMRLVFPTPSSPTRQILNLNVFASGSTVGFRSIMRAVPRKGVIKPAARFSESGTDWLEPLDVRDRADPILSGFEFRPDRQTHARSAGGDQKAMDETAADPLERHERPDLGAGESDAFAVEMRHGQGSDSPLLRDIDELREFCEAVLAKEPGREVVEAAGGASGGEHLPLVSQGNEEPLPRHPGGVNVVRLHVPFPVAELPGIGRPFEERHFFPSGNGAKYLMSKTLATLLPRLPDRLDPHPDPDFLFRHLAEVVHHPHFRGSALQTDDADEDRIRDPLRVRVKIRDGEHLDRPGVLT